MAAAVDAVIGNSSSGIYEAPFLGTPTVDVGDRQRGRLAPATVIHAEPKALAIETAIRKALALDCSRVEPVYGDGHAAERIVKALRAERDFAALLRKRFHLLEVRS